MSKATILFYDPNKEPWGGRLRQFCAIQGLRLRMVEPADLSRSVRSLFQGSPADRPAVETLQAPVPEPVLVFCELKGNQLDRVLQTLRRLNVPRSCLKAVLTPHNADWTFRALYEELVQERSTLDQEP